MAAVGHHVLTEAVILPDTEADYVEALSGLTVYLVGVRCPFRVAQERTGARRSGYLSGRVGCP